MLSDSAIDDYLAPLAPEQQAAIRAVRTAIVAQDPNLVEAVDTGKWFGGMLTYHTPGEVFLYALGPRTGGATSFHMMAYYALADLPERHGPALKRFLTGKSCIQFKRYEDLTPDAIVAIQDVLGSADRVVEAMAAHDAAKRKRKAS